MQPNLRTFLNTAEYSRWKDLLTKYVYNTKFEIQPDFLQPHVLLQPQTDPATQQVTDGTEMNHKRHRVPQPINIFIEPLHVSNRLIRKFNHFTS